MTTALLIIDVQEGLFTPPPRMLRAPLRASIS